MKQTEKKYWFKRRRYGWGWTPVNVQGGLVIGIMILVAMLAAVVILPAKPAQPTAAQFLEFFGFLILDIGIFTAVALAKGPRPRWRWGKKPGDNQHEDF